MSKAHEFDCGDGTVVKLNSTQLRALLSVPTSYIPFSTFWALRHRNLIHGPQHFLECHLTSRGEAVVRDYQRGRDGQQA